MIAASIPAKIPTPFASSAGPTNVNTIPQTSAVPGRASFALGFPPLNFLALDVGGIPPDGRDENGILLAITQWLQWINAGGPVAYDATFSGSLIPPGYPAGAIVLSTVGSYQWLNLADNNTTNPDSGGSNWQQLATSIAPYAGNPNGSVAGTIGGGGLNPTMLWDTANNLLWVCTVTGNAAAAVWVGSGASGAVIWAGLAGGTADAITLTPPIALSAYGTEAYDFKVATTNTGPVTVKVSGLALSPALVKDTILGPAPLTGGDLVVGNVARIRNDGARYHLTTVPSPTYIAQEYAFINASNSYGPGLYLVDTTAGPVTVVLEGSPANGDNYQFADPFGTWGINPLILDPASHTIRGSSGTSTFNVAGEELVLAFSATLNDWRIV